MSDIRLFRIEKGSVTALKSRSVALERSLQTLIEQHLEDFLGVRFLASEYTTNQEGGGRIDTLGIDENGCPVIIEYKRAINENVINQGLFYLNWLMDHRANFELLVLKTLGDKVADTVTWSTPRLLCIAGDFTKFDEQAVREMRRNIELIRYRHYGDLLLFELVNAAPKEAIAEPLASDSPKPKYQDKTVTEQLDQADEPTKDHFGRVKDFLLALGDDVQMNPLKLYIAFKRIRNFACVQVQQKVLTVYLRLDPASVDIEPGFTRDMSKIGHWGTGDLEVMIRSDEDVAQAEPLMARAYESS